MANAYELRPFHLVRGMRCSHEPLYALEVPCHWLQPRAMAASVSLAPMNHHMHATQCAPIIK